MVMGNFSPEDSDDSEIFSFKATEKSQLLLSSISTVLGNTVSFLEKAEPVLSASDEHHPDCITEGGNKRENVAYMLGATSAAGAILAAVEQAFGETAVKSVVETAKRMEVRVITLEEEDPDG